MSNTIEIQMYAGVDAKGQPFVEKLQVDVDEKGLYHLQKSPAFIKGLARGDTIQLSPAHDQFEIKTHSGNLCIRVFSKDEISSLRDGITPEIEKLGGQLDIETPRMLVYSIHVSCGFSEIEAILDQQMTANSAWIYGNVYDPADGVTPLNWWLDILKPE